VNAFSRDGARFALKQLEAIAKVKHVEGRGWYGLRRVATDLAESDNADDRVKDRLGGWQDPPDRRARGRSGDTALSPDASTTSRVSTSAASTSCSW
jgi:hypothetical protein